MSDGKFLTVVPTAVSSDTVSALEALLQQAHQGTLIGLAWVSLRPGNGYEVDIAGEARNVPVVVRGLLKVLDDQLGEMMGSR